MDRFSFLASYPHKGLVYSSVVPRAITQSPALSRELKPVSQMLAERGTEQGCEHSAAASTELRPAQCVVPAPFLRPSGEEGNTLQARTQFPCLPVILMLLPFLRRCLFMVKMGYY